jgi:hypothetical protein
MSEPKRIQRKRTKGWRMPEGAVYVGRPTRWGNPYVVGSTVDWYPIGRRRSIDVTAAESVDLFRAWIEGWEPDEREERPPSVDLIRQELAGRDLACWCPLDQPCHADVLLEVANRPEAAS